MKENGGEKEKADSFSMVAEKTGKKTVSRAG